MKKLLLSICIGALFPCLMFADKKAFIVTISNFNDHFSSISSNNDKFLLEKSLKLQGFNSITFVSEKKATQKNILVALNAFTNSLKKGDIAFVHFSTHGRQVQDFSNDEIDGLDEAFVCYDSKMEGDASIKTVINSYLLDDTLERVVKSMRTKLGKSGDLLISLDACHSGTGTRGDGTKRGGYPALTDPGFKYKPIKTEEVILTQDNDIDLSSFIVISGSQADVCNYEINLPISVRSILPDKNANAGSLTYAMCEALNTLKEDAGKFTYNKLYEDIKLNMSELEKVQVPCIEGNGKDRTLFGGKFVAQKKYFTIDSIQGNRIVLKAGVANGLYNGTQLYICKSGTTQPDLTNIIGLATVNKEDLFKTRLLVDSGAVIPKNAWLFIYKQGFKEHHISIDLSNTSTMFKEFILRDLPFLKEASKNELAELKMVKKNETNYDILKTNDNFSICYNNEISNLNPEDNKGYENLKNYLTDYFQYKNISSMDIKSDNYKVEFSVMLLKSGDTCRACTDARMVNGRLELYEGDTIKLLVKNKGSKPAYFNILDLQPDGKIGLIFTGDAQKINPSDLFVQNKEAVKLLPTNANNVVVIGPPYGVDIFKLIAFSYPEDLSDLQLNFKARGPLSDNLGSLIRHTNKVTARGGENKVVRSNTKTEQDGSTFEFEYVIKPKPVQ